MATTKTETLSALLPHCRVARGWEVHPNSGRRLHGFWAVTASGCRRYLGASYAAAEANAYALGSLFGA